ncbi:MAG: glycoside hydrolase family 57 protein [Candidatus Micrarchaeota archaeon]
MAETVFYFHVHQPLRLRKYCALTPDAPYDYFDSGMNKHYFRNAAEKCYLPANALLKEMIEENGFKCSFSISGVFLEQCEAFGEDVLNSFQELVGTGGVSLVQETYYHSLSSLFVDLSEFEKQVEMHGRKIRELFGVKPKIFRNTELLYDNRVARKASEMGFKAMLAEGIEWVLNGRSPNYVFKARDCGMKVFLRNYRLSDDIGFRFSDKGWSEWPLTAGKFANWIKASKGHCVNLFMDYETFGEHHWQESGIFGFMRDLCSNHALEFATLEELLKHPAIGEVNAPHSFSWADMERDASAWLGNNIQNACFNELQKIGELAVENPVAADTWRKLQSSDHLMYLCTKGWHDGDVHKHFSPYKNNSPVDNYANFMNTIIDFRQGMENEKSIVPGN